MNSFSLFHAQGVFLLCMIDIYVWYSVYAGYFFPHGTWFFGSQIVCEIFFQQLSSAWIFWGYKYACLPLVVCLVVAGRLVWPCDPQGYAGRSLVLLAGLTMLDWSARWGSRLKQHRLGSHINPLREEKPWQKTTSPPGHGGWAVGQSPAPKNPEDYRNCNLSRTN